MMVCLTMTISCGKKHPQVPEDAVPAKGKTAIFPDYSDVTIPCNIAPLNFKVVDENCKEVVARITDAKGHQQTYGKDNKVLIDAEEWKSMLGNSKGKGLNVELFVNDGDQWKAYPPFSIYVAEEAIDEYISYRLINPSYVAYEELRIVQRNLTNFEENDIYNNMIISSESEGQCINCHAYQNYHTDNMQFHMRQAHGGTMIVYKGEAKKVNPANSATKTGANLALAGRLTK